MSQQFVCTETWDLEFEIKLSLFVCKSPAQKLSKANKPKNLKDITVWIWTYLLITQNQLVQIFNLNSS